MRVLDRFECRNSVVGFHYGGVAVRTQDRRIHAQVLVTPVRRPPHSHFFFPETDAGVGNTTMVVQRQRPSVRAVGLLVDTVPFETVETVKRSSC